MVSGGSHGRNRTFTKDIITGDHHLQGVQDGAYLQCPTTVGTGQEGLRDTEVARTESVFPPEQHPLETERRQATLTHSGC